MNAPSPAAITGTFSDLKSVKTRSVVQLIIEAPIEQAAEIVRLFGFPQPGKEVPVAVARLRANPQIEAIAEKDRKRFDELPPGQQAGMLCHEPRFIRFLEETRMPAWKAARAASQEDGEAASKLVRHICGVHSRADIGKSPQTEVAWQDLHQEYRTWLLT